MIVLILNLKQNYAKKCGKRISLLRIDNQQEIGNI